MNSGGFEGKNSVRDHRSNRRKGALVQRNLPGKRQPDHWKEDGLLRLSLVDRA